MTVITCFIFSVLCFLLSLFSCNKKISWQSKVLRWITTKTHLAGLSFDVGFDVQVRLCRLATALLNRSTRVFFIRLLVVCDWLFFSYSFYCWFVFFQLNQIGVYYNFSPKIFCILLLDISSWMLFVKMRFCNISRIKRYIIVGVIWFCVLMFVC